MFVSSTLTELAPERQAVKAAINTLRLTPIMFEAGARPHPPADLYRSYLEQSDVFVAIYGQSYGWVSPDSDISGIEDEFFRSGSLPRLIYVKEPASERDSRLTQLLDRIQSDGNVSFRPFQSAEELSELLRDDLAVLITERFHGRPGETEIQSQTLTLLFADLAGSTPLLQQLGDSYQPLLRTYHDVVTTATEGHGGRVENIEGDGFFSVFGLPLDALDAAHQIQTRLIAAEWPDGAAPKCRIGIHTGTATRTDEGYVGLDVHRAARIGAAAQGGQVLVSSTTSLLVEDQVGQRGWQLVDLGSFILTGISRSERISRVDFLDVPLVLTPPAGPAPHRLHRSGSCSADRGKDRRRSGGRRDAHAQRGSPGHHHRTWGHRENPAGDRARQAPRASVPGRGGICRPGGVAGAGPISCSRWTAPWVFMRARTGASSMG